MGVYIKGVEKPKQCRGCFCYSNLWQDADGYGETCCWCGALRRKFNRNKLDIRPFKEVLPDCPLIEVKTPHGRLIDADKTWACAPKQVENMPPELEITEREKDITLAVISGLILQMPTVIEAEEGE